MDKYSATLCHLAAFDERLCLSREINVTRCLFSFCLKHIPIRQVDYVFIIILILKLVSAFRSCVYCQAGQVIEIQECNRLYINSKITFTFAKLFIEKSKYERYFEDKFGMP